MNYILFDEGILRAQLLPFTFMRPIAEIRVGISTLREKWEFFLGKKTSTLTEDYLSEKYPMKQSKNNILINAAFIPNADLSERVALLKRNEALTYNDMIIAYHMYGDALEFTTEDSADNMTEIPYEGTPDLIDNPWSIYLLNDKILRSDFLILSQNRKSADIPDGTTVFGAENIFIEEGAKINCAVLNAQSGPIYIGKEAEIMEGSLIRGPFALCEGSTVKMGAKIYGATTIGPHSKVGGELNNVVIFGYSNKAHDGFLGNSVLAEWCNLGADTNSSNLKNDYTPVKIWSYQAESFVPTQQTFCGLFMADHSKAAISTMFNTGTVVGVSANVFGAGFPRQFIPSFTWGGKNYDIKKAMETAKLVYARRNLIFDQVEEDILRRVYELTHANRR